MDGAIPQRDERLRLRAFRDNWPYTGIRPFRLESDATPDSYRPGALNLDMKPYRKLVAICSPQKLYVLQKALEETDSQTTEVIVMTARKTPVVDGTPIAPELDRFDRELMTAVIELAEKVGKQITPLVVPTNNALYAVMHTVKLLGAQELVVGASNKFTADEQLDQMAFYWTSVNSETQVSLTIRVLGRNWDMHYDIAGGNRIPPIT
jgi:hypothetical protein